MGVGSVVGKRAGCGEGGVLRCEQREELIRGSYRNEQRGREESRLNN